MKRILISLALSLAPLTAFAGDISTAIQQGDFRILIDLRARTNLIYQLDCVTAGIKCTADVFKPLWSERFLDSEDERALVREWGSLRGSIQKMSTSVEHKAQVRSVVPMYDASYVSAWMKARTSEFEARDDAALEEIWSKQISKEASERLSFIYRHFQPDFEVWWAEQQKSAAEFVPGIEGALKKAHAAELLSNAARFYGARDVDPEVSVHLVLQPPSAMPHSRGERVTRHMVVEVVQGERPEDRVPVIVHELAHHVFAGMPQQKMADFAGKLIASGTAGMPAWNLFDEVQATVIGNAMADRNLQTPEEFQRMLERTQSLYADHFIDEGARASIALFDETLGQGRRMPADFPNRFVAALKDRLGEEIETPVLVLRSMAVNRQSGSRDVVLNLMDVVKPWSTWGFDPLGEPDFAAKLGDYKALSAVIFAKPQELPLLKASQGAIGFDPDDLQKVAQGSRGVIVVAQRTPLAFTFALIGKDDRATQAMIETLPYCRLKPGICMRLEE